jgi:arabinofuranosyltransferase
MKKFTSVLIIPAAVIPAMFWFFFSLFYYGFLFPNTAYAKYMLSDISFMDKIEVGITYFKNSIHWDWASHLILLCALILALVKKAYKAVFIMCGVLCYLFFVLSGAAAATHMSGRFFALPFFISICLFTCLLDARETAVIVSLLISLFIIVHPLSSIKMGTEWYIASTEYKESIDTKWYAHKEGAALINYKQGKELPDHAWYKEGKNFKKRKEKIHLGGPRNAGGLPIGFFGFAAGQEKYIIDIVALSDPLRARLPVTPNFNSYIRSGHFFRIIPEGYIQSIHESENLIKDKNLSVYYGKLLNIISGPLFSAERIKDIIDMNLGKYQPFLDAYISRIEKVYKDPQMINVLLKSAGPVRN